MKPSLFEESATAVARRFGVSAKALRIYERMGLLKPPRTEAGWRVYRQAECERISAIVALRRLGLPLKRIGEVLRGKGDLAHVLALQEAALEEARDTAEEALALIRAARAKLANRRSLSPDELSNLVRRTAMSEMRWSPKLDALAQKHYTKEQLAELKSRDFTAADQTRVSAAWEQIYADLDALCAGADPASEAALAIGRRAYALIEEFTQGDPSLFKAVTGMKKDIMADPETASLVGGPKVGFALLGRVFSELQRRGEMPTPDNEFVNETDAI